MQFCSTINFTQKVTPTYTLGTKNQNSNMQLHSFGEATNLFESLNLNRIQIKVKNLNGKEIELNIEPNIRIERIKEQIEEKAGVPPLQQRLIFSGKQMSDEKTATDYKIQCGSVLHLVFALRGGGV